MKLAPVLSILIASSAAHAASPMSYTEARAVWDACGHTAVEFPDAPSVDVGTTLTATRNGDHVRVEYSTGGSGTEAVYAGVTIELDTRTCAALWARTSTYDGAFARQVRVDWARRGTPNDRELAELLGATSASPPHANTPATAMARAWLDHECDGGPDSTLVWPAAHAAAGPIAAAQPWQPGVPVRSPDTFWTVARQREIGARGSLVIDDADEMLPRGSTQEIAGVIVPGLAAPRTTFGAGTLELREAELPGRNGGRAIAIYDRKANRHRWVLLTRGCVQGTTVTWLGAIGGRAIGITRSVNGRYAAGDAVVVIDLIAGTAWAVALPDAIKSAPPTATLTGSTVTFATGATLDLTAALAQIAH